MMKSVALNAIVLYILFKSSVRDHIISKMPQFLLKLQSFAHLWTIVKTFIQKSCRLSRRSIACLLFVLAIWIMKVVWQRFNGQLAMAHFVEKFLLGTSEQQRRLSFSSKISGRGGALKGSFNRKDQPSLLKHHVYGQSQSFSLSSNGSVTPSKNNALISHRVLQRKTRSLRYSQSHHIPPFDQLERQNRLMIMGCIEEEIPYEGNLDEQSSSESFTSSLKGSQKSSLSKKSTILTDQDQIQKQTMSSPNTCIKKHQSLRYRTASSEQQGLVSEEGKPKLEQKQEGASAIICDLVEHELIDEMLDFAYV